ncbi:Retron-type reverse transcriptase [Patescibacteria group bacterium]|nr:MAG: Retron-type reverse transcriptase [Patescibacteria group bacterium]
MSIFEQIVSPENLFCAWREFRRGKRAKPDVQRFERHLEDNLFALAEDLASARYRHGPYKKFHIFDPKHRIIHKATVRDRVVHHAVSRVVAPLCEQSFIFDSYSCRIGKGTHAAVRRIETFARSVSGNFTGPCWALKCDIRKYFDSISHDVLLRLLGRRVSDPQTLELLRRTIESYPPVDNNGERERANWRPDRQSHIATFCERLSRFLRPFRERTAGREALSPLHRRFHPAA